MKRELIKLRLGTEKTLNDVIKPYRILFKDEGKFQGTVNSSEINEFVSKLVNWKSSEVRFIQSNLTEQKVNSLTNEDKRITLFYDAEVPINIMNSIMFLTQNNLPESTFNRLIIDWSSLSVENKITISFISSEKRTQFSADIPMDYESIPCSVHQPIK